MVYVRRWFKQNFISITYENKSYNEKKVPKTGVEQIENNGRSYLFLYPIRDLVQRSLYRGFYVCINQGSFLKSFSTINELINN